RLVLLVNGLGATPPMELAIVARDALQHLREGGFELQRAWSGTLLSALDMPGFSLSLLRVDDKRLALLDAATDAPAWPGTGRLASEITLQESNATSNTGSISSTFRSSRSTSPPLRRAALAAADALIAHEARLTALDAGAGDGDLGTSMVRGAAAIAALPDKAWISPEVALSSIGHALRRAIAGSSGPFYATAALRAARALSGKAGPTPTDWALAFTSAVSAIRELGGAKVGDRTMVDALQPAADVFASALEAGVPTGEAWAAATAAARKGCDATAQMSPRLGRASYLGNRALGIPDAGATAAT